MLVSAGGSLIRADRDSEGFSAGSGQFDSDITSGRYPRAALGLDRGDLIAVVSEGRADDEAGLTMSELAQAMVGLGAAEAINLDGGGSASLVVGGRLRNIPARGARHWSSSAVARSPPRSTSSPAEARSTGAARPLRVASTEMLARLRQGF